MTAAASFVWGEARHDARPLPHRRIQMKQHLSGHAQAAAVNALVSAKREI
ncbi:hypothetical protein [Roseicyclus sp.]